MSIFHTDVFKKSILFSIGVLTLLLFMSTPAQALEFGAQMTDGSPSGCGSGTGSSKTVSPSSWSSTIFDADHWGANCFKIYLNNTGSDTIPENTDVRLHIRLVDEYTCGWFGTCHAYGSPQETPWASDGGGWSAWAQHNDKAIDGIRIRVETRSMPAPAADTSVGDMEVSIQTADTSGGLGCGSTGSVKSTPLNSGWSSWATDGDAHDPNCLRLKLDVSMLPTDPPGIDLQIQVNDGGYTAPDAPVEVDEGDAIDLEWSTILDPESCEGSADDGDVSFDTSGETSGTTTVGTPSAGNSRTYTLTCWNAVGTSTDSVTVSTAAADAEITTFEARINTGAWSSSDLVGEDAITYEDTVELQWVADADSCSGGNFVTGGSTSGGPLEVTGPYAGEVRDYVLTCTRSGGSPAAQTISIEAAGNTPELTALPKLVYEDDTITLEWNLNGNDPANCTLSGPALSMTASGQTGTEEVTAAQGQMTYTMDCGDGGSDDATVNVQPDIFES